MFNPVSGQNVTSIALSGVNRAQEQFQKAASDVVNSFNRAASQVNANAVTQNSLSSAVATAVASNPESALVDVIKSKNAVKANMKVLEAENEMKRDAMDNLARRRDRVRGRQVDIEA